MTTLKIPEISHIKTPLRLSRVIYSIQRYRQRVVHSLLSSDNINQRRHYIQKLDFYRRQANDFFHERMATTEQLFDYEKYFSSGIDLSIALEEAISFQELNNILSRIEELKNSMGYRTTGEHKKISKEIKAYYFQEIEKDIHTRSDTIRSALHDSYRSYGVDCQNLCEAIRLLLPSNNDAQTSKNIDEKKTQLYGRYSYLEGEIRAFDIFHQLFGSKNNIQLGINQDDLFTKYTSIGGLSESAQKRIKDIHSGITQSRQVSPDAIEIQQRELPEKAIVSFNKIQHGNNGALELAEHIENLRLYLGRKKIFHLQGQGSSAIPPGFTIDNIKKILQDYDAVGKGVKPVGYHREGRVNAHLPNPWYEE